MNILQRWFAIRSISPSTQEIYKINIKSFEDSCGMTLEELYHQQKKECTYPLEEQTLYNAILMYKYELDNSNYAETTKKLKLQTVFSFCKAFKFPRPDVRQKKVLCEEKNYERPLTKKELSIMMDSSGLRERAFISLQSMTGMGSQEVRTLTIDKIIKVVNETMGKEYSFEDIWQNIDEILSYTRVFKIKIVRKKVNYRYITFIPPITMKHIFEYLVYRRKIRDNKQIYSRYDYIFVTKSGKVMTSKTVTAMYREIGKKCGFESEFNTYRYWRSHNIRKYFYNIVEDVVGSEFADEFLGHVPSKTTQAYARREYRMDI